MTISFYAASTKCPKKNVLEVDLVKLFALSPRGPRDLKNKIPKEYKK